MELAEKVEKDTNRQRDVKMKWQSFKAEINNRSVEAIKSYRHEAEQRRSTEIANMQKDEQDKYRAFMNYLSEQKVRR